MKFQVKENAILVFKQKWIVSFAVLKQFNAESDILEKLSVIENIDYTKRASPTVYSKKKDYKIRVCTGVTTRSNEYLLPYNCP